MDQQLEELTMLLVAGRNEIVNRLQQSKITDKNYHSDLHDSHTLLAAMMKTHNVLKELLDNKN